jgi:four helix bundle protein
MTEEELKSRLKVIALRVIHLVQVLPKNVTGEVIGKQLIRSVTSVAANYYSACKARSKADFLNKLGIVEEEADETQLWIELIIESGLMKASRLSNLLAEVKEITAIMASSRITIKGLRRKNPERIE